MNKKYPKWFTEEMARCCEECGKYFYPQQWEGKRKYFESQKRYFSKKFCNNGCRSANLSRQDMELNYFYGKSLTPWNKGKNKGCKVKQQSGYVRVFAPDYKTFDYEHRLVTNCPAGYIVHHVDGDKANNNPSNLEIMTQSEHIKLHAQQKYAS